ncbi:MAG: NAD(P)H-dependent oxidoreductase subunit E [Anaerolineales bacterium]|nr:NAD(P)H-dependent oxidoreductase subunit E [Anaerolineales bacterium]
MSLDKKYSKEIKQILAKYPPEHKRSAVMPLLYLAQREEGYVNKDALKDIARILDITETDVASIVGFYTLYHDKKGWQIPDAGLHRPALRPARRGGVHG